LVDAHRSPDREVLGTLAMYLPGHERPDERGSRLGGSGDTSGVREILTKPDGVAELPRVLHGIVVARS
jgi:hypothetical protein